MTPDISNDLVSKEPETVEEMLVAKRALDAILAESKEALAPLDERIAADKAAIKALQEQVDATAQAKWDLQINVRKAQREAESMDRRIEQAKRAAEQAAEWKTLEQRWDLMTIGAPWREWAKDHQLSGAKKITYEGRMILGDTMGLGKTLTSLIAIDMIEAATKDASPDHPVEFGSMK